MLVATAGPVTPPTMPPTTAPAGPPTAPPETAPTPAPLNLSPVVEQAARLSAAKPAKPKLRKDINILQLLLLTTAHCNSYCSAQSSIAQKRATRKHFQPRGSLWSATKRGGR